jgi:hypothetical protein
LAVNKKPCSAPQRPLPQTNRGFLEVGVQMVKQRPFTASGVLIGGLLGAVSRPLVVYAFWLIDGRPVGQEGMFIIVLISCAIGFGVGSAASVLAQVSRARPPVLVPVIGAVVGAALAFIVSLFTVCFLCGVSGGCSPGGVEPAGDRQFYLYLALMAITGALPGAVGGLVHIWVRRKQAAAEAELKQADPDSSGRQDI